LLIAGRTANADELAAKLSPFTGSPVRVQPVALASVYDVC